jgi:TPR repeat protein
MRLIPMLLACAAASALTVPVHAQDAPQPTIEQLRARAAAGDAAAQNDLAGRLFRPDDPAHHAEVRELWRRSAEAGNAEGKANYALVLMEGIGGPADVERGRRLRAEAAAEGSVSANMTLAARYLGGEEGYPRDPVRATAHLRVVATSSTPRAPYAQWRLGLMYYHGAGTAVDHAEAYRWFVRSADGGEAQGMASRAVMLALGQGVAENDPEARIWYRRAAETGRDGFENGLRGLGWMLATGEGGPIDLPTGIAYLMLANAAGAENAELLLGRLRDRITPEIEARARAIGSRWIEEHRPR